jgi:hypothetical protein
MSFTRPTSYPNWTVGNPGVQDQPTSGEKFGGFVPNQRPAPTWMNWLLGNISDWINWLDQETQLNNSQQEYDAVVGTNGTHADINSLMADPNIAQIYRVLVTTPQTLLTTQTINKSDIDFIFKPSAVYSKALTGSTKGLSITASRVRIYGGRWTSYNGGGDIAIEIGSGVKNCIIDGVMFSSDCTTTINDLGTNNVLGNNLQEV